MNILNRREVFLTWSSEDLYRVEESLARNNIKYRVKCGSFLRAGISHGAAVRAEYAYEYRIYVHKNDYESAKYAIRKDSDKMRIQEE